MASQRPGDLVDPDVDLRAPVRRRELLGRRTGVLAVIALGGAAGALARYGLARALPTGPSGFPWATFWTNVTGCLLIGVLVVLSTERLTAHRLIRPFLGVGVLGGFTTFSTYAGESRALLAAGRAAVGFGYLAGTVVAALLAVELGVVGTRWVTRVARVPRVIRVARAARRKERHR
jgi:CrcB protein